MPSDPMLLAHLETLVEVARRGSLGRAAEALFVTQPALTARIKALEADVGTELFTRSSRGLRLTDAGRALLPYAERTLALVEEGRRAVRELGDSASGTLVIAAAPAVSTYLLPGILRSFERAFPRVRLGVRTGHTEEVLDLVLRREADVGIGRPVQHPEAELIPVFDDELMLVVAAGHPFAKRGKVRLAELAAERLILFDRSSSYYELTSSLFRQAGVVPASTMELDNVEAAKKMVAEGLGVALLPRMALAAELKARTLRPVAVAGAPTVKRPIVAIRRRDAGAAMGPVAEFLRALEVLRR